MNINSADFLKLTLQEVADMLLDQESNGAICKGIVEDKVYTLKIELICGENNE